LAKFLHHHKLKVQDNHANINVKKMLFYRVMIYVFGTLQYHMKYIFCTFVRYFEILLNFIK